MNNTHNDNIEAVKSRLGYLDGKQRNYDNRLVFFHEYGLKQRFNDEGINLDDQQRIRQNGETWTRIFAPNPSGDFNRYRIVNAGLGSEILALEVEHYR